MLSGVTSIRDALPVCWGRGGRRDDFAFATWLDVIEVFQGCLVTDGFVAEMTIFGGIDCQNKSWKIYKQTPQAVITNESTTALSEMFAKAVEGGAKRWDMEDIPNENLFAIEGYDGSSGTEDWGQRLISHANV